MSASPHFALRKGGEIAAFLESLTLAQAASETRPGFDAAGNALKSPI